MNITLKPIISEKSLTLASAGTYLFEVPMSANKLVVADAVSKLFKVEVVRVRTSITQGKLKRFKGRKGRQSDTKRAFVQLKTGQSIKIFEENN